MIAVMTTSSVTDSLAFVGQCTCEHIGLDPVLVSRLAVSSRSVSPTLGSRSTRVLIT